MPQVSPLLRDLGCRCAPAVARYPNLKQVFLTSRTYGGYANGKKDGCLMPEPYAYELGFAVQRLIAAQIRQVAGLTTTDPYAGDLSYNVPDNDLYGAPWFDWGPYLWANGEQPRAFDGLNWCDGQNDRFCPGPSHDFRHDDPSDPTYWGDFTHVTASGLKKVADKLVLFVQNSPWLSWARP